MTRWFESHQMRLVRTVISLMLVPTVAAVGASPRVNTALAASQSTQQVTLDNVQLTVTAPFLANVSLQAAEAGNAHQVAAAYQHNGRDSLSITAVPFGSRPASEKLPIAEPGAVAGYMGESQQEWLRLGAQTGTGASALLFGRASQGSEYTWATGSGSGPNGAGAVLEWITEESSRIWIVRVEGDNNVAVEQAARGLSLSAASANAPTTLAKSTGPAALVAASAQGASAVQPKAASTSSASGADYSSPSWWSGLCDASHYKAGSTSYTKDGNGITPRQLGGSTYRGLQACGPRPFYNEGPDVMVTYPGASWPVAEFECVELSMRYMQLAWGVHPYPANGVEVVRGYWERKGQYNPQGPNLVVQQNGSANELSAGDVLSESEGNPVGHTAVVLSTNLDAQGTGSITVLEQNASASGTEAYQVNRFVIADSWSHITSWLHNPAVDPLSYRGVAVRSDNASGYTVNADGSIHAFGGAPAVTPSKTWQGQDMVRGIALRPNGTSGYTVDKSGGLYPFGDALPVYYGQAFPNYGDVVRGIALTPDGSGGYTLDEFGGVHEFGTAPFAQPTYAAFPDDTARAIAVRSDGRSGYIVDKLGGIHTFGQAPDISSSSPFYKPGWDIARGIVLDFDDVSGYVLDAYGVVYPFGAAPVLGLNPNWQGTDKARGIALNHNGAGGVVVDVDGVVYSFGQANEARGLARTSDAGAGYALYGWGGIVSFGGAPLAVGPTYWPKWDIARKIVVRANGSSGYTLDGFGGIHQWGGAPDVGGTASAYWNSDIARDIALRADGQSGYVLDGWGGVHQFGNAPDVHATVTFWQQGWDIARGIALRADGQSGYVLDGWGGLHQFGNAPDVHATVTFWQQGWDIARGIALRADGQSGYVLDGWGGLHPFGNAPAVHSSGYWPGWDVARGIVLNTDGKSGYVLDANGGRHPFNP